MNTNQALMICGCFRERLDAGWWCDGDYYQIVYKPSKEPGTTFEFKGMTFWLDDMHVDGDWLILHCGTLAFGFMIIGDAE